LAELAVSQHATTAFLRGGGILCAAPCADCRVRPLSICRALPSAPHDDEPQGSTDWQTHGRVRARRNICAAGDALNLVYVVCEGWAFRFIQLPNGRRQILSIILPGDVFTATSLLKAKRRSSVQAITDVQYCGYSRGRLQQVLINDPDFFSAWAGLLLEETSQIEHLLVDVGCRSAEQRIARLILSLRGRMRRRGMAMGTSIPFPLRQRLIAEIAGLTPEHVNRVMRSFREAGLIETGKESVTILNLAEFRRIGELRA
jgi:CRP-like cAMP-binding protein